jgi:hypothetical protein
MAKVLERWAAMRRLGLTGYLPIIIAIDHSLTS